MNKLGNRKSRYDTRSGSVAQLIIGILGFLLCVLVFIPLRFIDAPIDRADAVEYTGTYTHYTEQSSGRANYFYRLHFADGKSFDLHRVCSTDRVKEALDAAGFKSVMTLLINPRIEQVIEIRVGDTCLLTSDDAQNSIYQEALEFMWLGIVGSVAALALSIQSIVYLAKNKTCKK